MSFSRERGGFFIMQRKLKHILWGALAVGFVYAGVAYAATLQPFQGGTGFSTSSAGTVGQFLQVASTSPFLTYQFGTPTAGATTTINGVNGPTFTIQFQTTSTDYSITTSSANLFLNILASSTWLKTANNLSDLQSTSSARTNIGYTAANGITISAGGVISDLASSTWLKVANNLSDLNNTSTARTNLGLGDSATLASSTWFKVANNLSESTNTSTLRTNIGYYSAAGTWTGAQTYNATATFNSSTIISSVTANSFVATDPTGKLVATSTPSATPAGSTNDVQFNSSSAFTADTGIFTYSKAGSRLVVGSATSSVFIGTNANFATSTGTTTISFSFTGASTTWIVPSGVTSITIGALGAGTTQQSSTLGGAATGTLSVASGQTYFISVGGTATGTASTTGGFGGGGNANVNSGSSGIGGGGMTWFSASSSFATSTVILVAGGGGGSATTHIVGGAGGGTTGGTGGQPSGGHAGTGGTQSAGGAAGTNTGSCGASTSTAGTAGQGGLGAGGNVGTENGGGGGGGGYFGGGGGGCGSTSSDGNGGGGGSSFLGSALTSTSTTSGGGTSGSGSMTISYQVVDVFSTSTAALYVGGHITTGMQNSASSSVSSCGANPSLIGNDTAGQVTVGGGVITSCTVTFGKTYSNPPICTANDDTSILAVRPVTTTSTLVLSSVSTFAGDNLGYICVDY